jgi:hypothetical protein
VTVTDHSQRNLKNAWYHSVKKSLSSHLLSKNIRTERNKSIIILVVCIGMKLDVSLREEYRLRAFENLVLKNIFEPKRYGLMED